MITETTHSYFTAEDFRERRVMAGARQSAALRALDFQGHLSYPVGMAEPSLTEQFPMRLETPKWARRKTRNEAERT